MYVVFSDIHIGDINSDKNLPKLFQLLNNFPKEYKLIFNGDTFELVKNLSFDERHAEFLKIIQKFDEVYFIIGNHDWLLNGLQNVFQKVKILPELNLELNNNIIKIIHGHQSDLLVSKFELFDRFLVRLNFLIYKLIKIDIQLKIKSCSCIKKLLKSQEKKLVEKYLLADIIIAGHTHCAKIENYGEVIYYNTGDWVNLENYYILLDKDIKFIKV